jgi:hypothetical protein
MTKQNNKFDRRRALECKLIGPSKTHKGYYKYDITIGERDGSIHKEPAYGKDMQDAISRLINKEITNKVEKTLANTNSIIFILLWVVIMGSTAVITTTHNSPIFILFSFAGLLLLSLLSFIWYKYLDKG